MSPLPLPLSMSSPWPAGVELRCVPPQRLAGPPEAGEILVRPPPGQTGAALAEAVLREGLMALPCGAPPLRRLLLPPGPALDDLLAAWLCALLLTEGEGERILARVPRLPVLCGYTAQLREGILPGEVAPERSLGGVYLAMVELYRDQQATLIARGGHLIAQALAQLREGRSPLSDDVLEGDETLSRERTYLAAERRRYLRDREAGQVLSVRVGPLAAHLLCLRQPTSILFRLFAPRDPGPGGVGFDLVLTERAGQDGRTHFALFADPTRRLPLRPVLVPLCRDLSRREAQARAQVQQGDAPTDAPADAPADGIEPWYDGALHHHQRLASPRAGTALPPDEVRRALRKALRAAPVSGKSGWRAWMLGGGLGLCALGAVGAVGALGVGVIRAPRPRAEDAAIPRGDWQQHRLPHGPKASPEEREALLRGHGQGQGPVKIRNWALLVAASAYAPRSQGGLGPLRTPWRDACVLRELLVRRFGYRRQDVVVLADSPCLRDVAGPPTRQRILWTMENMPVRKDDTLLFYYAGHGSIEEEPGGRYGYLQPAGWEGSELSREDRGLRMRVLAELLRDKVAARHQLLLLDSCHSGEAAVLRGDDPAALDRLEAPVRAGWRERPVYAVITAGGVADLALEERLVDSPLPHSLFVRGLLEALSWAPHPATGACRLRADQDPREGPDGLITDGEIFKYLARRVPELRAGIEVPGLPEEAQRQVPEWNPWAAAPRGRAAQLGEFLLIPREGPPARCDGEAEPDPDPCTPAACPSGNRGM